MVELSTAEHVIHYMRANLKLSRYDDKFLEDIASLPQFTTNQVELFYKIIYKYRRQFSNNNLLVENLIELPWKAPVIESSAKYTNGHVSINDGMIIFKCPFNKSFIDHFRKQEHNQYLWNKEKKQYEASFSTHSLKLLIYSASTFFKEMELCEISKRLLESVYEYQEVKYWNPTMTYAGNRLYIMAITESLAEALGDIELNTDVHTLNMLAWHGVTIDPTLYENTPKNRFAATLEPTIELSEILNIVDWLKELGCDVVYFAGSSIITTKIAQLKKLLTEHHIDSIDMLRANHTNQYSFPVIIHLKQNLADIWKTSPSKVAKVIQIVNSEPINIK